MEFIDFDSMVAVNILLLKMNTYFFHESGGIQAFADSGFYFIIKVEFLVPNSAFEMVIGNGRIHRFQMSKLRIMGRHHGYGPALQQLPDECLRSLMTVGGVGSTQHFIQ